MKCDIILYDEDMISAQTAFKKSLPLTKWQYFIGALIAIIFWFCLFGFIRLLYSGTMVDYSNIEHNIGVYVFIAAWFIYMMSKYHQSLDNDSKIEVEITQQIRGKMYMPNYSIEFLSDTLMMNHLKGQCNYPYQSMDCLLSDEKHLYFVFSINDFIILPFRCLQGKEEELFNILKEKCPQQFKKNQKILLQLVKNKSSEDNPYSSPKS